MDWWRDPQAPPLALVTGAEGAGRTSALAHFLQWARGAESDAAEDRPVAVFVFSLAFAPNSGHFFDAIHEWARANAGEDGANRSDSSDGAPMRRATAAQALAALARAPRGVLVFLDALELEQSREAGAEENARAAEIECVELADFLMDLAGGAAPGVRLLATAAALPAEFAEGAPLANRAREIRLEANAASGLTNSLSAMEDLDRAAPRALALARRAALFRLPVSPGMIAALFAEESEDAGEIERMFTRLCDPPGPLLRAGGGRFAIAGWARAPLLAGLEEGLARECHDRIRRALESVPGGRQPVDRERPSDPAALDLLEEIQRHALGAGNAREAFNVYWFRLGGLANLGARLGDFARANRACAALERAQVFAAAQTETESGFFDAARAAVEIERATALDALGHLEVARRRYERGVESFSRAGEWENAASCAARLAGALAQSARLIPAIRAARRAIAIAEEIQSLESLLTPRAFLGYLLALTGDYDGAAREFAEARNAQEELDGEAAPLYSQRGLWEAKARWLSGRSEEARELALENRRVCESLAPPDRLAMAGCDLLLAEIAAAAGELDLATRHLEAAERSTRALGVRDLSGAAAAARARILLAQARDSHSASLKNAPLTEARLALERALCLALRWEQGLRLLELLLLRAEMQALSGDSAEARVSARAALYGAEITPPQGAASGLSTPSLRFEPFDSRAPEDRRCIFFAAGPASLEFPALGRPDCGHAAFRAAAESYL